jgi:hypothetical protein
LQVVNRVVWLAKARRVHGIARGLSEIPTHIWRYRRFRGPVSPSGLAAFLRARRTQAPLEPLGVGLEPKA